VDGARFDRLARTFARATNRRGLLAGLLGFATGSGLAGQGVTASTHAQPCDRDGDCPNPACEYCDKVDRRCKRNCYMWTSCCPKGRSCCGNADCRNLDTDNQHCGRCFNACGAGKQCCEGRCVNTRTNHNHCGGCAGKGGADCREQGRKCCAGKCIPASSNCCKDASGEQSGFCPSKGEPKATLCCPNLVEGKGGSCCNPDTDACCKDGACYQDRRTGKPAKCCPGGGACLRNQVCCGSGGTAGAGGARCCWKETEECCNGACVRKGKCGCPGGGQRCGGECCPPDARCSNGVCCVTGHFGCVGAQRRACCRNDMVCCGDALANCVFDADNCPG
jgi:hypothetical protein